MKKIGVFLIAIFVISLFSQSTYAQSFLAVDSLKVQLTDANAKTIFQSLFQRGGVAKLYSSQFFGGNKLLSAWNGYNYGRLILRTDSVTASMDTYSIE